MKYTGMTVNERLYILGLIDCFSKAIKEQDFQKAIDILIQTELTFKQASSIVDEIKNNPKKMDFNFKKILKS